jgi:hypothetical protein
VNASAVSGGDNSKTIIYITIPKAETDNHHDGNVCVAGVEERRGKGQEKGQERVTAAREKLSLDHVSLSFNL